MERTVLNPPDELPQTELVQTRPVWTKAARSTLLRFGRWVFLGVALGILGWRLGMDGASALDAVQKIGLLVIMRSFLAVAGGMGVSGLAWRGLLRTAQR